MRTLLLALWIVLISSLFYDPWTVTLTRPDNVASPFRIDVAHQVLVQGRPLVSSPYPMGARIFWTMIIPIVPMFLMLFGHEAWRRICPLSLSTQLAQMLGLQIKARTFNRRSGQVERRTHLLSAASPIARNLWFIQFGFLWCGITGRLLFMNADRTVLACFLLGIIGLAAMVGLFFGGKTWCNYFCPISPVQKIYTGPGGLLDSKAYRSKGVSQSTCRQSTPAGDQSACVGCIASCPDTDLERSYWDNVFTPGKRFAYYGYFGLVVGFYSYYYFYSGNWDYYFSGAWTHEDGQLAKLMSPGFYFGGASIPIPKLIAAPLTTAVFVFLAYLLGVLLERGYGWLRNLLGKPVSTESLRHQGLTFSAFATFNAFYLFGGRPNLNLLPPTLLKIVDVLIVLVSTMWLARTMRGASAIYRRESLAQNMLRQLSRLKMSFAAILEGRTLDELNADEVYILSKTLSGLPDDKRESLYRKVLREALFRGEISAVKSLEAMTEIRQQLAISEDEHSRVVAEIGRSALGIGAGGIADPGRLRLSNYRLALEHVVRRCLESGRPLREELKTRQNDREVRKLRGIFDISDSEHDDALSELLDRSNLVLREAGGWLEEIAEITVRIKCLTGPGGWSRVDGLDVLLHHLECRRRDVGLRVLRLLAAGGDGADTLARWCNVSLAGRAWEVLELGSAESPEPRPTPISPAILEILREDVARSEQVLASDDTDEFHELRSLLRSRPQASDFLGQMARGSEPAPAAVALYVLQQIDPEQGRAAAEAILARVDRHWLIDEVARSVANEAGEGAAGARERSAHASIANYAVEATGTPAKMIHLFRSEFFRHLDLEVMASIARGAEVRVYQPGGIVCRVGEPSDRVFVICGGGADVFIEREGRKEWTNAVGEGDSIGELGVLTRRPRSATVIANRADTTLISIDGADLISVLNRSARAAMGFLILLSTRQQGMLARMSWR